MKEYRHENAIIRIKGNVDREKIREATVKFFRRVENSKRNRENDKIQNGNKNTSRAIGEQQVLDKQT